MNSITRRSRNRGSSGCIPLLIAISCHSACAAAADVNAGFTLGVAYSDNINLAPQDGVEETIARTGIELSATNSSRKLDLDIRGSLEYFDYLNDTYDSDLVGALDALVDLSLVEDRVRWIVRDNYGRTAFDPFQPARPENWENINYLTTGPTAILYQAGRNESGVDLRYSNMNYETRPYDNERLGGRFWIGREVRRNHTLSINVETESTEFDNGFTPDYDRNTAFLRYEGETSRNEFTVDVGYTEQEILSEQSDGIMLNFGWTRRITTRSEISLNAGRQFSDQGNVFRYQQDITRDLDSVGDLTENGSPFLLQNVDIIYSLNAERTTVEIRVGASEEEYETEAELDRADVMAEFYLQRDFTRSLFASMGVRYYSRDFKNIFLEDDSFDASLGFGYRLSAAFEVSLSYSYYTRDSSDSTNEFDENRGELTLTYSPAWGR